MKLHFSQLLNKQPASVLMLQGTANRATPRFDSNGKAIAVPIATVEAKVAVTSARISPMVQSIRSSNRNNSSQVKYDVRPGLHFAGLLRLTNRRLVGLSCSIAASSTTGIELLDDGSTPLQCSDSPRLGQGTALTHLSIQPSSVWPWSGVAIEPGFCGNRAPFGHDRHDARAGAP